MKNLFVFVSRRMFLFLAMLFLGVSFAAAQSVKDWNKDWSGKNSYGDARFYLTLSMDKKKALNEYNDASKCNGFMNVYMVAPGGPQSVLESYEFQVQSVKGNTAMMTFKGARSVDLESGTCKAVLKNGRLQLIVIKGSQSVLFNKVFLK